eukprot:TRINITY_DN1353_c0_g1_i1.p1 TRINITY_DN1353_c0_g1~~TRINITY_DN1353_c0_g1_i1.p1  ORF type:complete len:319 (-),score=47.96 TRINITY_DN1353_c0_g1_i1:25-933(-)
MNDERIQSETKLLKSIPVSSICVDSNSLITIRLDDTIGSALALFNANSISSAPIFDGSNIVGSICIMDILSWSLRNIRDRRGDKNIETAWNENLKKPIRSIVHQGMDPFWPISEKESIWTLISSYFALGIHRCPVSTSGKNLGHISQSDVIAFMAQQMDKFPNLGSKTIRELGLQRGPVLSISKDFSLLESFSRISESRFSGVAIIDDQRRLVNNLSASDFKGIVDEFPKMLSEPTGNFLEKKSPPITCTPEDKLSDVIKRISQSKIHRIFVVDSAGKPTNVITLTKFLQIFNQSPQHSFCC